MIAHQGEELPLRTAEDVVRARQSARALAMDLGFTLVEQTKIVTAASELARNTVIHGAGGLFRAEALHDGPRRGLRLIFEDRGPGIPDVNEALRDGYTTGTGLGLGLGGARRLMSEFAIEARDGGGTVITTVRWR